MKLLLVFMITSVMMLQCQRANSSESNDVLVTSLSYDDFVITACRSKQGRVVCANHSFNTFRLTWKGGLFLIKYCLPLPQRYYAMDQCLGRIGDVSRHFKVKLSLAHRIVVAATPLCGIIDLGLTHPSCITPTKSIVDQYTVYSSSSTSKRIVTYGK